MNKAIGQPIRRKEDVRLLTGRGRFTDDFSLPHQTYAIVVRSPYPHAEIKAIDADRAWQLPGVLGVFSGADCAADNLGDIPHRPLCRKTKHDLKLTGANGAEVFIGPHVLLPTDRVRHVGEAVAMVVAESRAEALDAAEAVHVDYDPLPFNILASRADPVREINRCGMSCPIMSVSTVRSATRPRRMRPSSASRPCGLGKFSHRPRDRRADRAAGGAGLL